MNIITRTALSKIVFFDVKLNKFWTRSCVCGTLKTEYLTLLICVKLTNTTSGLANRELDFFFSFHDRLDDCCISKIRWLFFDKYLFIDINCSIKIINLFICVDINCDVWTNIPNFNLILQTIMFIILTYPFGILRVFYPWFRLVALALILWAVTTMHINVTK